MEAEVFASFIEGLNAILSSLVSMFSSSSRGVLVWINGFLSTVADPDNKLLFAFLILSIVGAGITLVRRVID